jgi:hypothetical protein
MADVTIADTGAVKWVPAPAPRASYTE